jgi:uncharacterized alkaline shock family protein YloU
MANELKNKSNIDSSLYQLIEDTVLNCYGVYGVAYETNEKKGNADSGIVIRRFADSKLSVEVYLIVAQDVKITEVLRECQNQLKFTLNLKHPKLFKSINVFAKQIHLHSIN